MNLIYFMADVKPLIVVFVLYLGRYCYQGDCGRFYSHIFWQMLLPRLCEMVTADILLVVV